MPFSIETAQQNTLPRVLREDGQPRHFPIVVPYGVDGAPLTTAADIYKDLNAVTITALTTVWAPAAGKKVRVIGGTISVSVACSVLFEDHSAGITVFRTPMLMANTPYSFLFGTGRGILLATAENVLKATSSVPAVITGVLFGTEEIAFTPLDLGSALKAWYRADVGLITNGAAQFTAANYEYLSIADNTSLSGGDVDMWGAIWFWRDSNSDMGLMSKYVTGQREFVVEYFTDQKIYLSISADGTAITQMSTGSLGAGAWHHVMWYHDAVNDLIGLALNGGAFVTATHAGGIFNGTAAFELGRYNNVGHMDGRLDSGSFAKSPVGGIAALATTIRDRLYNSGAGLIYSGLTSAEKTDWGLVSWWKLNEISGTRNDAHGTNHLTDNATVTYAVGVASGAASADGDPISQWQDQSGNGYHLSQATANRRGLLKLAIQNGRPVVRFDGVDDVLRSANYTFPQTFTAFVVVRADNADGVPFAADVAGPRIWEFRGSTTNSIFYGFNTIGTPFPDVQARSAAAFQVLSGVRRATEVQSYVDGASDGATATTGTPDSGGNPFSIGNLGFDAVPFLGDVGEAIYCDGVLSDALRQQVEVYLQSKYGTP